MGFNSGFKGLNTTPGRVPPAPPLTGPQAEEAVHPKVIGRLRLRGASLPLLAASLQDAYC
jgi:hypothetical protein